MNSIQFDFVVFGVILILAIIFDFGVFSKRSGEVSIKKALYQSLFWVALGLSYCAFVWWREGETTAMEYLSAYLMEKSLSIDNIFVFILIFSYHRVRKDHVARALMIGILLAIVFRIIFITVGVVLVSEFRWILYIFGAFLVYTGIKIFVVKQEEEYNPSKNIAYRMLNKLFPILHKDVSGQFTVKKNGKTYLTNMFVVTVLLATTDIVFALDSIPAVFAISERPLVIYTSNIFAVLGLRALFFLLKGAVAKFQYLQQGIATVLVFIGLKMLVEIFHIKVPVYISLIVIVICLGASIAYSINAKSREEN